MQSTIAQNSHLQNKALTHSKIEVTNYNKLVEAAKIYATHFGWPVFPVRERGKTPLTAHGFKDASKDETVLARWWRQLPRANIGLVTGSVSGLLVLDIDPRHNGDETLRELEKTNGDLPRTPSVLTGGGGVHYFFKHSGFSVRNYTNIYPGIDIRGDGGYVVAPPSIHESGGEYYWEVSARIDEIPLSEMPQWLLSKLIGETPNIKQARISDDYWCKLIRDGVFEGRRNQSATQLAGHLFRRFVSPSLVLELMFSINKTQFRPPLSEQEIMGVVNSVAGRELIRRKTARCL